MHGAVGPKQVVEELMYGVKRAPTSGVRALEEYCGRVFFCQVLGVVGGVARSLPAIEGALMVKCGQVQDQVAG